jgi:hypothetical protein
MNESNPMGSGGTFTTPQQRQAPHPPPLRPPGIAPPSIRTGVVAAQTAPPTQKELEPISLVEDESSPHTQVAAPMPKKIQAFGMDNVQRNRQWKRQLQNNGTGATRMKSFHGKYSEQGLDYLDAAVNDWLDSHADVEVKFVTSTVMTFEGKIREPALVLNVWY